MPAPRQTVRVCVDNSMRSLHPSLKHDGAAQTAVRIIMENLNGLAVYVDRPIAECRALAQEDSVDAHLSLVYGPENIALFRFPLLREKADQSRAVVTIPDQLFAVSTAPAGAPASRVPLFLAFTHEFYARHPGFSENVWSVFDRIGLERRLVRSEETHR